MYHPNWKNEPSLYELQVEALKQQQRESRSMGRAMQHSAAESRRTLQGRVDAAQARHDNKAIAGGDRTFLQRLEHQEHLDQLNHELEEARQYDLENKTPRGEEE